MKINNNLYLYLFNCLVNFYIFIYNVTDTIFILLTLFKHILIIFKNNIYLYYKG